MLNLPPVMPIADVRGPIPRARQSGMSGVLAAPRRARRWSRPAISEYTTPALYSDRARQRRTEGIVTVAVRVDDRGSVTNARVVKGLGDGLD